MTQGLGYSQAPVVVVTDAPAGHHPYQDSAPTNWEHWSGFRPDRLRAREIIRMGTDPKTVLWLLDHGESMPRMYPENVAAQR